MVVLFIGEFPIENWQLLAGGKEHMKHKATYKVHLLSKRKLDEFRETAQVPRICCHGEGGEMWGMGLIEEPGG